MPSKARKAFNENFVDIKRLLDIHNYVGGTLRGRRYDLEVLNKSAIVLITSYWEAYCEDIAAEGLEHIVKHSKLATVLPKELKKQLANELKSDKNELALWLVADDGWRTLLSTRLKKMQEDRNKKLNSPKSNNIDSLFMTTLGIPNISDSWGWWPKMTPEKARAKLDKYVDLRGAIAHRGKIAEKSVTKKQVADYFKFINHLAARTGGMVNLYVDKITGIPLWTKKIIKN